MIEGTILVVDDEKMIRDLLVDILSDSGEYRVLTAVNGKDALNICQEEEVDLVFTDLRMPEMGGMELLEELRKRNPDIPVVILTGYGKKEDVIHALRLGASNFLMKPQEMEMVHTIAGKILRMKHKERLEQRIFDFFLEEQQSYLIPCDLKFTLPLIDLVTEKVGRVGICNLMELMNVRLALDEALVNSIVHGSLEIPSLAKGNTLEGLVHFNEIVKERSRIPPYCNRKVKVAMHLTSDYDIFSIEDEGPGFNWRQVPQNFEDTDLMENHGRGLILIRAFMSSMEFNEKGNQITMLKLRSFFPKDVPIQVADLV